MSRMENKPYIKHIGEINIILTILYLFYGKSNPIYLR